jgi:hypothetical protein
MSMMRVGGCSRARLRAVLAVTAALALAPAAAAEASGVTVTDLDNGVTASQLAQSLAGGGVSISDVTFTGANRAAGAFTTGASSIGFDTGIVLSSGNVQTYDTEDGCSVGVEGPNGCYEDTDANPAGGPDGNDNSTTLDTPGDTDLDALLPQGSTTEDATVLEFNFIPLQPTVTFTYVFGSEEYSDYSNTGFNDVFAFFVNGTNCALVPGTSEPVSVNTINNGNDQGGDTTPHHPELFRDNVNPSPTIDSQMDGLTTALTCTAAVTANQSNHIKLAIADVGDSILDSSVFIQAGSFVSGRQLTVSKNGTGTGTVTSSPAGINCGATCSHTYVDGTMVTLTPTPSADSTFAGWSGACTGTGACTVTMDQARNVTATFSLKPTFPLTVSKVGTGSGSVTSSPAGIDCGATCSHSYADGTSVTLTPTPSADSMFAGWSGACTGTGDCTVTMDQARNVTATFSLKPTFLLTVSKNGTGSGAVSSSPAGINCGATCSHSYLEDTQVTLTPSAAPGSTFAGWSGACTGTGDCQVTMDQARNVTATFNTLPSFALNVSKNGTGSGTVTSSPSGIDCGATCSHSYTSGTVVTLTASPASGSTFAGWSGACSGTGGCTVTMDQARSVTATFNVLPSFALNVSKSGTGSGTITSSPSGIDCGATCSHSYTSGTVVTLTASPASGSTFAGWSGACSGTGGCTVTMDQVRSVTATFNSLSVGGPGSIPASGLFCGVQHRGKCNGLKVKGVFDRPGNAVWTFAAYNPTPGHKKAGAAAGKKLRLGNVKRAIKQAGTVTIVFKLKKGKRTNKLYGAVKKRKMTRILVTLKFTTPSGDTQAKTKIVKLKL